MFFTLLEIFQYVHGHLVLLQCKAASCLSSLYFSRVSKWNQAASSPALLPFKFFLPCFCVACTASQWSCFPWIIAPSPNTWHSAKLNTECCTSVTTTPGRGTDQRKIGWKSSQQGSKGPGGTIQQPAVCSGGQEGPEPPGLHQKLNGQKNWERGTGALVVLSTDEMWCQILWSVLCHHY